MMRIIVVVEQALSFLVVAALADEVLVEADLVEVASAAVVLAVVEQVPDSKKFNYKSSKLIQTK
jgi:hypothetical protein